MRKLGVSSSMLYMAGFGSIAASMAAWMMSQRLEDAGVDRADRWGIFIGEWAPTFFALGTAMRLEEQWGEEPEHEEMEDMRTRTRGTVPVS
ncbi:hypothetical protein [Actinomadura sp. HBU206391]|uniref:hypothetical protein n=1 Tax=Actinomadura sp. HBU206391 TaxID=2731692 RepID=UPI0021C83B80|nr:hypothetical protein [Actinomadura sp. HBU206391]